MAHARVYRLKFCCKALDCYNRLFFVLRSILVLFLQFFHRNSLWFALIKTCISLALCFWFLSLPWSSDRQFFFTGDIKGITVKSNLCFRDLIHYYISCWSEDTTSYPLLILSNLKSFSCLKQRRRILFYLIA